MRVVHLITGLSQGGAEAMLEKLLLTARKIDPQIEQSVINLGPPGVVGARLECAGIPVESLALNPSLRSLMQVVRLTKQLRGHGNDTVVQTWLWHADLLGGMCARIGGNHRVVWNLRNSMPRLASTKRLSRGVAYICARLSRWVPAKIVCNSQAALRAHTSIGYWSEKCVVIPNGFDLQLFSPSTDLRQRARDQWNARAGEVVVGMVARVDPLKDHAGFIRAASQVARLLPQVRFVLVGAGATSDRGIRTLLAQSDLTERFVLEERRDDVQAVMNGLDVFCLASKSEGFPNVLGEAMACGTPAITTDVGDARDIVGDDNFVAAIEDPTSLAACIMRVAALSPDQRLALGLAQRARIAARFSIEQVWRAYRELYAGL